MKRFKLIVILLSLLIFNSSFAAPSGCDLNRAETLLKSEKFKEAALAYIKCAGLEELNDKSDGELIYKWYKEASYCYFAAEDLNSALSTMEEALAWAKRNGNSKETAESHFNKGTILVRLRLLRDAVYSFGKALTVFSEIGSPSDIIRTKNTIASIKLKMERYSEAKSILNESLETSSEKKIGPEKTEIAKLYGDIYYSEGSFDEAEKSYMKALKFYQSSGDLERIGDIYDKIGDIKRDNKDFKKAYDFYIKSEKSYEKAGNLRKLTLETFKTASIFINRGDFEKAKEILTPYIPEKEKKNKKKSVKKPEIPKEFVYFASISMGDLERELKNYKKSLEYYLAAMDCGFRGYGLDDEISLIIKTADSLALSGDYENALAVYQSAESKLVDVEGVKRKTSLYIKMGMLASGFELYDSAINFYEDALSLNRDNPDVKIYLLTRIGEICYFKKDFILSDKMFRNAKEVVESRAERAGSAEKEKLKAVADVIESYLFMTGFQKNPLESLVSLVGRDNSKITTESVKQRLKGSSLLYYKTLKGSEDIFGNSKITTAVIALHGKRVKAYRIEPGNIDINKTKKSADKLKEKKSEVIKSKDKLEYFIDSYKMLHTMKDGKKKDRLKLFAEKQLFDILVKPYLNDFNGSKEITVITDSYLLKDLDFKNLVYENRKFGDMFRVEKRDIGFILNEKEK